MLITERYVNRLAEIVSGFFKRKLQVSIVDFHQLVLCLKQAQRETGVETAANDQVQGGRSMLEQISQGFIYTGIIDHMEVINDQIQVVRTLMQLVNQPGQQLLRTGGRLFFYVAPKGGVPIAIERPQCLQQIRNELPYAIIILIEAKPGNAFTLGNHLLIPLRQQRGFAKSSTRANDAQTASLHAIEEEQKP